MVRLVHFTFILVLAVFLYSCKEEEPKALEEVFCDAENVSSDGNYFVSGNKLSVWKFNHGEQISSEKANSGKSSLKLTGEGLFGFAFTIERVEAGDEFHIEVWRYTKGKKGKLVASNKADKNFYVESGLPIEKNKKGWGKLEINLVAPAVLNGKNLIINVWNPDKNEVVYFDDLKISYLGKKEK